MHVFGRLCMLGLGVVIGCGTKPAPRPEPPRSGVLEKEPREKADLSPVSAPAGLIAVGRLKRPGPIADTLARWAGLPAFRTLLAREIGLVDEFVDWSAPVELAVALPSRGRRSDVQAVVSFGVTSVDAVVTAAREKGRPASRVSPEVFAIAAPRGADCMVGPSSGNATARLVCGDRPSEVEALFPYATRGLPHENLGNRDIELELRAEPLRRRYSTELAGARLFAGFVVRQLELDHRRFDRALADAAYGLADELVLEVEDTDSFKLGGALDEGRAELSLELAWKFRSTRSWLAAFASELGRRPAPPPPAFTKLPAESTSAGYRVDVTSERMQPLQATASELVDAWLEHEGLGKDVRQRAARLVTTAFNGGKGAVWSKGTTPEAAGLTDAERALGWWLGRLEQSSAEIDRTAADVHALLGSRELWKVLAKRLELPRAAAPRSELGPLPGKGAPPGARVLSLTIPYELAERLRMARGAKGDPAASMRFAAAYAPDGPTATIVAVASSKEEAARHLRAYFEAGKRLEDRTDLSGIRATSALTAEFFTMQGLLASLQSRSDPTMRLPRGGTTPMVWSATAELGPPVVLSGRVVIPEGAFADVPAVVALLIGSLAESIP